MGLWNMHEDDPRQNTHRLGSAVWADRANTNAVRNGSAIDVGRAVISAKQPNPLKLAKTRKYAHLID